MSWVFLLYDETKKTVVLVIYRSLILEFYQHAAPHIQMHAM